MNKGRPKRTGPKPEPLNMMVPHQVKKRFDRVAKSNGKSRPKTLEYLLDSHEQK
jgi:hypothetical protein